MKNNGRKLPVIDNKTGKVFSSAREAADFFKVNPSTINKYCDKQCKIKKLDLDVDWVNANQHRSRRSDLR